MTAPSALTARQKLEVSRLRPTQLELLGDDVDLANLYLALNHQDINILEAVTDVVCDRTCEGASTMTVSVIDQDRVLLRSGRLSARNDIEVDGLFFRLSQVTKRGSDLEIVFEDRVAAVLRTYDKTIKQSLSTSRAVITRAQFVLRLLREVQEFTIPYVIPELTVQQPIVSTSSLPPATTKVVTRGYGIPTPNECTVKGAAMTESQRAVANKVLDAGVSAGMGPAELVMAIMCGIQESSLTNLVEPVPGAYNYLSSDPKQNPIGVFQQRPIYWSGSPHFGATRDVVTDALAFYNALDPLYRASPGQQYYTLIDRVQNSGNPTAYAQWRTEAERIVTTYGANAGPVSAANSTVSEVVGGTPNSNYEFYRGQPPVQNKRGWKKENSWDCIQRLADEVNYLAFVVSGTFYFIKGQDLFRSQPVAVLDEDTEGVNMIDGTYVQNSKAATLTVECRASKWAAPPGSVVQIRNMGPWDGRWLVNDINRSLFEETATLTLKKPLPVLPEPGGSNIVKGSSQTWSGVPAAPIARGSSLYRPPGPLSLVQPVPVGFHTRLVQGVHETSGLADYLAGDFGGNPGAPVIAVEAGTIVRFSGYDPSLGPNFGPGGEHDIHGPFGWSIYLLGDSGTEYYYTHLATRNVPDPAGPKGETRVHIGQQIGTIANYDVFGTPSHTHVGVHPGASGHPDIYDLLNAKLAVAVT